MRKTPHHFHAALIDVDGVLDAVYVRTVAAALEKQVYEHFAPAWHRTARVTPSVLSGQHPLRIELRNDADIAHAGFHLPQQEHQALRPYAVVDLRSLKDEAMWPRVASHELLEMLADPWGTRTITGPDLQEGEPGTAEYIVEVGDPCNLDSYTLDEYPTVPLSDFVLPSYYHPGEAGPYSHCETIDVPLGVREGGYVAFLRNAEPYWRIFRRGSAGPVIEPVPIEDRLGSCYREQIDFAARSVLQ